MEAGGEENVQILLEKKVSAADMDACARASKEAYDEDGPRLTYGDAYRQIQRMRKAAHKFAATQEPEPATAPAPTNCTSTNRTRA